MIKYTEQQSNFETMLDDIEEGSFFANYDNIVIEKKEEKTVTANTNNVYKDTQEQEAYNRLTDEYKEYTVKNNILPTSLISGFGDFVLAPINIVPQKETHVNEKTEKLNKVIEIDEIKETKKEEVKDLTFLKYNSKGHIIGFNCDKFVHEYYKKQSCIIPVQVSYTKGKSFNYFIYKGGAYRRISEDYILGDMQSKIKAVMFNEDPESEFKTNYAKECLINFLSSFIDDNTRIYEPDDFNNMPNLICFKNGILDLRKWEMLPHDPKKLFTIQIPYNFDPNEVPDKNKALHFRQWVNHLVNKDIKKYQTLMQYIGATISNIPMSITKKAMFLVGEGNTGKSFIFKLLKRLLGENNVATCDFYALDDRFSSSKMYNKKLVGSGDLRVDNGKAATPTLFKLLTGGDPISYEQKFEPQFDYTYKGAMLYCANRLPKITGDRGDHVYDRMLIIVTNKAIEESKRDPELFDKIVSNDMSYILYEAMQGLKQLISNNYKFTMSDDYNDILKKAKSDDSPMLQFLNTQWENRLLINENLAIQESLLKKKDTLTDTQKEDLEVANQIVAHTKSLLEYYASTNIVYTIDSANTFYESYVEFCERNRNIPMNYNNFQNEMIACGFILKLQKITINKVMNVQRRFVKSKPTPFGNL